MIVCPYCEQDYIYKVEHKDLDGECSMCYECYTFWKPGEVIKDGTGLGYEVYVKRKGELLDWSKLKKKNKL